MCCWAGDGPLWVAYSVFDLSFDHFSFYCTPTPFCQPHADISTEIGGQHRGHSYVKAVRRIGISGRQYYRSCNFTASGSGCLQRPEVPDTTGIISLAGGLFLQQRLVAQSGIAFFL